jgi:hypothetical protein
MIPDRFDALAKALPAATRRDAMRVLVGLPLAGGLASLLTPGEPASARRHGRKPTSPNDYRCNGECLCWLTLEGSGWCGAYDPPLPGCTSSEDCAPGEVCWVIDGICTCEGSDGNCYCEGLTSSCVPVC